MMSDFIVDKKAKIRNRYNRIPLPALNMAFSCDSNFIVVRMSHWKP